MAFSPNKNGHCPICHYNDVIMSAMASQITSVWIVCSIVCPSIDQRKHQSSASLAFVRGIYQWQVISYRERPVTRRKFPFDDVIMVHVPDTLAILLIPRPRYVTRAKQSLGENVFNVLWPSDTTSLGHSVLNTSNIFAKIIYENPVITCIQRN